MEFLLLIFASAFCAATAQTNYVGGWDPRYCCYPPPEVCCPTTGCPTCLDIAVIADRSSSVGEFRYRNRIIPFLRLIARSSQWTIGMADDQYQVSVTTFAGGNTVSDVVTHWNFGDMETASRADIIDAINGIRDDVFGDGGLTNTFQAMEEVRTNVLGSAGDRPNCDNLCVVITDGGVSDIDAYNVEVPLFQEACGEVIVVVVETSVMDGEIDSLATRSDLIVSLNGNQLEAGLSMLEEDICEPPVCPICADVVLLLDRSGSVGEFRWRNRVNPFIREFAKTDSYEIGSMGDDTWQFSAVTFGTDATLEFGWGGPENADRTTLRQRLKAIRDNYDENSLLTNLGAAMQLAREQILMNITTNRPDCMDICIIVTDGAVTEPAAGTPTFDEQLPLFQSRCDQIIAVGISTSVDADELNSIATDADFVVLVEDFDALENFFDEVFVQICPPDTGSGSSGDCCPFDFPFFFRKSRVY